ncbi:MAG TPA: hypothetical protein VGJ91_24275, partial [Polyangiaceae bacterium]
RSELSALLPFGPTERPFVTAGAKQALRAGDLDQLRSLRRVPPAGLVAAISRRSKSRSSSALRRWPARAPARCVAARIA